MCGLQKLEIILPFTPTADTVTSFVGNAGGSVELASVSLDSGTTGWLSFHSSDKPTLNIMSLAGKQENMTVSLAEIRTALSLSLPQYLSVALGLTQTHTHTNSTLAFTESFFLLLLLHFSASRSLTWHPLARWNNKSSQRRQTFSFRHQFKVLVSLEKGWQFPLHRQLERDETKETCLGSWEINDRKKVTSVLLITATTKDQLAQTSTHTATHTHVLSAYSRQKQRIFNLKPWWCRCHYSQSSPMTTVNVIEG